MSTILSTAVIVPVLISLACFVVLYVHRQWRLALQQFSKENRGKALMAGMMLAVQHDTRSQFWNQKPLWCYLVSTKHFQKTLKEQWGIMMQSRRWWEVGAVGAAIIAVCRSIPGDGWTIVLPYLLFIWVASTGVRPSHFLHVELIDVIEGAVPVPEAEVCADC
jgi:hypothetical protein